MSYVSPNVHSAPKTDTDKKHPNASLKNSGFASEQVAAFFRNRRRDKIGINGWFTLE